MESRFAHSCDILVNTRNKFHICVYPCIILYIFHFKTTIIASKQHPRTQSLQQKPRECRKRAATLRIYTVAITFCVCLFSLSAVKFAQVSFWVLTTKEACNYWNLPELHPAGKMLDWNAEQFVTWAYLGKGKYRINMNRESRNSN